MIMHREEPVIYIDGDQTPYQMAGNVEYLTYETVHGRSFFMWQMKEETCETVEELVERGILVPAVEVAP